jgi:hypothetical protein
MVRRDTGNGNTGKKSNATGKKRYRKLEHVFGKIPGEERKLHQQHIPEGHKDG